MLYLVATPIGNLKDITARAVEILQQVDGIICEDTRRTSILLNHYQIRKPLYILNDFNEPKNYLQLLDRLESGQNLALVSDAGTPLISDPGYKLVRECIKRNIPIDSLPGPVAAMVALTLSGLPPDKFLFLGYPPEKPGNRKKWLENLKQGSTHINATNIIYVSPFKLKSLLAELLDMFEDIEICLAKELTKINQTVKRQKISQWIEYFKKTNPKGEYTMLFNLDQ